MSERRATSIILGAGRGSRLGGPKSLLAWPRSGAPAIGTGRKVVPGSARAHDDAHVDEIPLAIAHAEARLAAESDRAVVVVRRGHAQKLLAWVAPGIDLLVSDADDALGAAGSLGVAAHRLADELAPDSIIVITPVDALPALAATVGALVDEIDRDAGLVAAKPMHGGRGGHPIAARASLLALFRDPKPPTLREALAAFSDQVAEVDVTDARVLGDLDTPADVARYLASAPRFLG
ncbi:MAG TPA: hypothetical protein VGM56_10460 [Byssovorax sp.]